MTQPIQEPSTPRNFSRSTWNENQLYRRPRPRGPFVPTVFQGRQISPGFQSISSGSEIRLRWNAWDNGDDTVFTPQLTTGALTSVILQLDGLYLIEFMVSIQALTSTAQLVMIMNDAFDSPTQVVHPAEIAGAGADYLYPTDHRVYPPFQSADSGDAEITFDIAHNHGSARSTQFGTYFSIVYLGPFRSEETS